MNIKYTCNGPKLDGSDDRAGCGYNLTELINEVEEDGEVHEISCPKCEAISTVRRTPRDD